jgi:acetyl-CoA acyltransferase
MKEPFVARQLREVVFVDGVRTPFGKAKGQYAETRADDLVIKCIRELMRRNPNLPPERVDEVAIAATTQIGDQGLTIGRTAALLSGLPQSTPGYAIDRMCAGAMTAVTTTAGGIAFGSYDVVIAGGVEHMGRHPMGEGVDPNPRIISEKVVDPEALSMGNTAENLHDRYPSITKQRVDAYAVRSQEKTAQAYADAKIQPDLVPVAIRTAEAGWGLATADEPPRPGPRWRPAGQDAFPRARTRDCRQRSRAQRRRDHGPARRRGDRARARPPVKMRLVSYSFAGVEPEVMGAGPIPATEKALKQAGLTIDDIDAFEINEAFAVQVLAFLEHFGIDDDDARVNPYGGAIAMGHPLASSGVRLMTQLARQFEERPEVRYGMSTMCIGLGMGGTVIWENPHWTERTPDDHDP